MPSLVKCICEIIKDIRNQKQEHFDLHHASSEMFSQNIYQFNSKFRKNA